MFVISNVSPAEIIPSASVSTYTYVELPICPVRLLRFALSSTLHSDLISELQVKNWIEKSLNGASKV